MGNLIKVCSIKKSYRKRVVVNDISFTIHSGETIAMIGANGAGKTTIINMISGISKVDSGEIHYWQSNFKEKIGIQLQTTPFFEGYSVIDNLKLFSAFYGVKLSEQELDRKLVDFGLLEVKKIMATKLSLGQQKRLAILITTLHQPDLVILDEPSAGLDPRGQREVRELISKLKKSQVAVLFSSHDMLEVAHIADRIIIINQGELVANGSIEELFEEFETDDLENLFYQLTK